LACKGASPSPDPAVKQLRRSRSSGLRRFLSTFRARRFAAKPQQTFNFNNLPTGDDTAGELSGRKHFVDRRPADAGVLRGELDGDAETLLERDVADFLASNFRAHLASTQSVNGMENMRVGCLDLISQNRRAHFSAIIFLAN